MRTSSQLSLAFTCRCWKRWSRLRSPIGSNEFHVLVPATLHVPRPKLVNVLQECCSVRRKPREPKHNPNRRDPATFPCRRSCSKSIKDPFITPSQSSGRTHELGEMPLNGNIFSPLLPMSRPRNSCVDRG